MENLFGDVLSDLCAGLVGRPRSRARGEPRAALRLVRGGSRQRPGHRRQGHGQPHRPVRSAAMMLEHIGQRARRRAVSRKRCRKTLAAGKGLTRDLGGDGTTATITEQIIATCSDEHSEPVRSGRTAYPLTFSCESAIMMPVKSPRSKAAALGLDQVPAVQQILQAAGVRHRLGRAPGRLGLDGARRASLCPKPLLRPCARRAWP